MNPHVTDPGNVREPRGGPVKFLYPSGSRPLDGYTIKRGVGRGGFGEVYYATSDGGKEVALKLVRRNLDIELRGVIQCLNLKHPNLLALYDIKQDGEGDTWVVMEYVGGETLDCIIERYPQGMPEAEVLQWIQGIAGGVAYLHDHGIVHRDLKPGNIFSDDGVIKLGDYGLSKFISASRRSGQTESVGTVHYMAPEVANGRYGKEIDLYALGIILYEMLTGHVPFEGESVGEVLMKHLTAQPDLSGLQEPYRTVVGRALDKDPARRMHSVQELLDGLPVVQNARPQGFAAFGAAPAAAAAATGAATSKVAQVLAPGGEEPIWKAIRENWLQAKDAWDKADLNPPMRVALIVAGIIALVVTSGAWISVIVVGGLCYGGYRVVRSIVLASSSPAATAVPKPAAVVPVAKVAPRSVPAETILSAPVAPETAAQPAPAQHRRAKHPRYRERALTALPVKSTREKTTELLGSMLLAAGAATALCILMLLAFNGGDSLDKFPVDELVSLALLSTAGTWSVLVPAKFWEGTIGEPGLRRFILLIIGLSLGTFAWGVDRSLALHPNYPLSSQFQVHKIFPLNPDQLGQPPKSGSHDGTLPQIPIRTSAGSRSMLYDDTGAPTLKGYLAYFGFLMPVLSWWRLADPVRRHRVSLWSAALFTGWGYLLSQFWSFPIHGVMIAGAMALAVQLSSPWMNVRAARRAA